MKRPLVLALAYFVTGWIGLQAPIFGSHITLFWLPTGIAVAALYRWGNGVWPGIYVGALLVNLATGSSWPLAAGIALGNSLGPLATTLMLHRTLFNPAFERRRDVGLFMAASGAGMALSATGGSACLYLAELISVAELSSAWKSWWMGDTVGVLLVAPLLLNLTRKNIRTLTLSRKELLIWGVVSAVVAWLAFMNHFVQLGRSLPIAFLTLPLITWAALRFGIGGAVLASFGFSGVAVWSTVSGQGFFIESDSQIGLILLWTYMATIVALGLLITALESERRKIVLSAAADQARLRAVLESVPSGVITIGELGIVESFNHAAETMFGYRAEEVVGRNINMLMPEPHQSAHDGYLSNYRSSGVRNVIGSKREVDARHKDGSCFPIELGVTETVLEGRKLFVGSVSSLASRKKAEAELRIAAAAFESQQGTLVTDANGVILKVNKAFVDSTGYSAAEAIGQTPRLLKSGRHDAAFYSSMWEIIAKTGAWQGEIWDRRKNGEVYPKWLTISAARAGDGTVTHYVGTHQDITERKIAEQKINDLAFYDPLTHLPNRTLLLDRLRQAMTVGNRNATYGSVLFIDLDRFKTLNDTLGHDMGDLLLQQVAQRLTGCVREGDTVARLGGDEFVVTLGSLSENQDEAASQTEVIGGKLLAVLNQTYRLGEVEHRSSASIGATLFRGHEISIEEVLKQADLAMYKSKERGRNALHFFDPNMETAVMARASLEADLREAIERRQFVLYYQAQVVGNGRVTGAEALVRWRHPGRGMVSPIEFIALAEETGLIIDLGHWVLETACNQLLSWAGRSDMAHLMLAVNVSSVQFRKPDFVAQVLAILDQSGANPQRLKLELTESLMVDDVEDVIAKMAALKARGISFSLDDFGTGYSSLAYLKRLPLDQLKIDQSFVRDILIDPNDAAIARTIVALAESLGLSVIAEGVETESQRAFLVSSGCQAFQGYFFSRPVPVGSFEEYARRV